MFRILAVVGLCTSVNAFAGDPACNQAYANTVSGCAQNLESLAPNLRPGAQKGCVSDAKVQRDLCADVKRTERYAIQVEVESATSCRPR